MGKAQYIAYFMKNSWSVLAYRLFRHHKRVDHFRGQKGITLDYSNELLKTNIHSNHPFAAIRFGAIELSCLNYREKIAFHWRKKLKPSLRDSMKNNAGIFPVSIEGLLAYSDVLGACLPQSDLLGISGLHMEDYFAQKLCPAAKALQYEAFEPLRGDWILALAGKRVLVVSPFADDIAAQYPKRDLLFPQGVIPDFTLLTYRAVMTLGEEEDPRFASWSEALTSMMDDIRLLDFDIALVGAGAYGTPLCLMIKEMGKMAIQTGGSTPTMFGIIAKRWEKREHVARYYNEAWIRPSFRPKGYQNVEQGCYW